MSGGTSSLPQPAVPPSPPEHTSSVATSREAFSINFVRHRTVSLVIRRALAYGALGYLLVNGGLLLGLLGTAFHCHAQSQQLQHTLQDNTASTSAAVSASAVEREIQGLRGQAREDLAQLNTIILQQGQRLLLGGKLAALTKTLPPRTWITKLSGDREHRTIAVQAVYLIDPHAPYDLPAKGWMEALRADPSFGHGLKRLDLKTSCRKPQGNLELFSFELVAEWRPLMP